MKYNPVFKRSFDIIVSAALVIILSPVFYLIIILIRLESNGPVFFRQNRIGRDFKPFKLIKFRSMSISNSAGFREFDPGDSSRVTSIGSFLRKTKLDELPELLNVLNGHMSIVGPRPEVARYVRAYPEEFGKILKIKPGVTDFASIKYHDEEAILGSQANPEHYYRRVILPDKLCLARRYTEDLTFKTDLAIVTQTLKVISGRRPSGGLA